MANISFGPFSFDSDLMSLTRDGQPVSVARPGAALLAAMLDANGAVVGKNALIEAAWPGTIVEEANLTVQVAALRKALGQTTERGEWMILTVPRVGYRLVRPAAVPASVKPVIAVLPFANLSNDPEQAFFADGVVDDLITALSRFKTFAVIGRNSTAAYSEPGSDLRETAATLGVRYLLQGSLRRSGLKVRVSAQLIDGATGANLWADRFEGEGMDVFAFQDQIVESVIGLVEPRILKAEIERARRKRPESFDAWDLYVQALPIVQAMNVPAYDQAIALLDRAVALDPGYAPVLILAAWAYEKRYSFGKRGAADKEMALLLSDKALEADPDDATVLAITGWFRMILRKDWAAIASCMRAATLNPNNLLVLEFAGIAEFFGGDLDRSIAFHKRALELGPGAPNNYASLAGIAMAYGAGGRWEECIFWAERAIEIYKGYVYSYLHLACAHAQLGHREEARAALDAALAVQPDMTIKFATQPMRFPERRVNWVEGLRKAGLPEQ
jgi:TolB-like protein